MLKEMRRHARYFYVLFVVIILTFIFWGVGGVDKDTASEPLAQVAGQKITLEEYWRNYDRVLDLYRDVYKEKFDEKMREELKQKVLESMIDDLVLLKAAADAGLKISDRELEEAIKNDPSFTRDGVFSSDIYERTLELNRMTPAYFEAYKRRAILLERMRRIVETSVDLSPAEEEALKGDEKAVNDIREAIIEAKRQAALKSFINGIRQKMNIKVNAKLIS